MQLLSSRSLLLHRTATVVIVNLTFVITILEIHIVITNSDIVNVTFLATSSKSSSWFHQHLLTQDLTHILKLPNHEHLCPWWLSVSDNVVWEIARCSRSEL